MRIGIPGLAATIILGLSAVSQASEAQNTDPRSVLQRYIDAQNGGELAVC